jgi:hypothetical protein
LVGKIFLKKFTTVFPSHCLKNEWIRYAREGTASKPNVFSIGQPAKTLRFVDGSRQTREQGGRGARVAVPVWLGSRPHQAAI